MVCANKEVSNSADNSIVAVEKNQYETVSDNIAAESIDMSTKLKRGASTNDSQNQSSQGKFLVSFYLFSLSHFYFIL